MYGHELIEVLVCIGAGVCLIASLFIHWNVFCREQRRSSKDAIYYMDDDNIVIMKVDGKWSAYIDDYNGRIFMLATGVFATHPLGKIAEFDTMDQAIVAVTEYLKDGKK